MDQWSTIHLDELARVMGPERVRHPVHGDGHGEWDVLRALPRHEKRILTGAGYLTPRGLRPDVAADIICGLTRADDTCEAMEWYCTTALRAVVERRRVAYELRTSRLARRQGYKTYHQLRTAQAVLEGYDTYRHKRREKGWRG